MAVKIEVLPKFELLVLAYQGSVTRQDFSDTWSLIKESPDYEYDFDDLGLIAPDADHSDINFDVALAEAERYVQTYKSSRMRPKRTAFLCATEMQRVIVRMFAAYIEANCPSCVEVKTFLELTEALDWMEPTKGLERKFDRAQIARLVQELGYGWCVNKSVAA